jgi:hypothetical protein
MKKKYRKVFQAGFGVLCIAFFIVNCMSESSSEVNSVIRNDSSTETIPPDTDLPVTTPVPKRTSCKYVTAVESEIKPIARTDVVPYQRIDYGTTFNFGVVAFSKPGIDCVEFVISGQGYAGGVKTSTEMTLNTRVASAEYTGVWEYWVPISSSEFSSNGEITVTPTVYDNDGNTRKLVSTVLIVEGASADFNRYEAWVNTATSDGEGTVGNPADPYPTVQSAINATQSANGGSSSGNIIYLAEGTYDFRPLNATTNGEWLTITKDASADRDNVVINNNGGPVTINRLNFDSVTLQSDGENDRVIVGGQDVFTWTNHCRRLGAGRYVLNSNPVIVNQQSDLSDDLDGYYSTDDYTYDVFKGYSTTDIIRGAVVEKSHDDVFENFVFVVNAKVDDINNGAEYGKTPVAGATAAHSDVLQVYQNIAATIPVENRLAFNVYATNVHMEGIMRSSLYQPAGNNAFVNVFIELRELPTDGNGSNGLGNDAAFTAGLIGTSDDESHLLLWHSSFAFGLGGQYYDLKNSSFYGNLFWGLASNLAIKTYSGTTEWAYNHFENVYGVTGECDPIPISFTAVSWECPRLFMRALGNDYTVGDGVIDISTPGAADFGYPIRGSVLIDRLPEKKVPCDVFGNPRDSSPDVGAIEY